MTRRFLASALTLTMLALVLSACTQTVRVETGERVVCTYGEVVSSSVKVVNVPADQADRYQITTKVVTCDRHKKLEQLYATAQAALISGDTSSAASALQQIVQSDPAFREAAAQLADIHAGKKPKPDTSGPSNPGGSTAPTSTTTTEPVGPVANLSGWVPDSLSGYTAAQVVADAFTLTREYTPTGGGRVESLVIVVEQYKDAAAAKAAIAKKIQPGYPSSASHSTISGRSVYLGTDGRRFAIAAWNENGVMIAVEASARDRVPASLKPDLTAVVSQLIH
jgi:hypothetical protein